MGCGASKDPGKIDSDLIDKQLRKDGKATQHDYKLLLLGAGESGKSTFAKQLKLLYVGAFTEPEKIHMKEVIFENVIYALRSILEAAQTNNIKLSAETDELAKPFLDGSSVVIDQKTGEAIQKIYADPALSEVFTKTSTFHLIDSAKNFLSQIDRISAPNYVPTEEDMLLCRAKTTGIQETTIQDKTGSKYTIIDVGGQRSERKKWVHCFQDVTSVIFFVAMSEYDLFLYEDDTTNRMHESLKLFDEICNSNWFATIPIILFLNKKDLFEEKIKKKNITTAFPDYTGPQEYEPASEYIKKQFQSLNEHPEEKGVYPHITQATDKEQISKVFESVKQEVVSKLAEILVM